MKEEAAMFYPPPIVGFKAIFCLRIVSAIWLHITDCDETYNYWEPVRILFFLFVSFYRFRKRKDINIGKYVFPAESLFAVRFRTSNVGIFAAVRSTIVLVFADTRSSGMDLPHAVTP